MSCQPKNGFYVFMKRNLLLNKALLSLTKRRFKKKAIGKHCYSSMYWLCNFLYLTITFPTYYLKLSNCTKQTNASTVEIFSESILPIEEVSALPVKATCTDLKSSIESPLVNCSSMSLKYSVSDTLLGRQLESSFALANSCNEVPKGWESHF